MSPRRSAALLALLAAAPPASPAGPSGEELALVDGSGVRDVREVGEWSRRRGALEGSGSGAALLGEVELGGGDFTLEAEVSFDGVDRSEACFELAGGRFGFASRDPSSCVYVSGRELGVTGRGPHHLTGTERRFRDGKRYELQVRRRAGRVSFHVDGDELYGAELGDGPLGAFGFHAGGATLRVHAWRVAGELVRRDEGAAGASAPLRAAVDAAVDRGVEFLLAQQLRDGSWTANEDAYRSGQTALCTYALVKSGVPPDHPAVARALAFLEGHPPRETYTVACHLLALEAVGDAAHAARIEELAGALVDWQEKGVWGYPYKLDRSGGAGDLATRPDLSNSQFAALGLRAAAGAGVDVPARTWEHLLRAAYAFQEEPRRIEAAREEGRSGSGERSVAGFRYRLEDEIDVTGSMTAAGVCVVAICREALDGRLRGRAARDAQRSIELGLEWLGAHFTVRHNPGKDRYLLYYLYGLERVGALLDVERIGDHAWYVEGAQHLLATQTGAGAWAAQDAEADTCFALLFLRRATARAPRSGEDAVVAGRHSSPGEGEGVFLFGSGESELSLWVGGFAAGVAEAHGGAEGAKGLRIARVEYLVDGAVVATVDGDPGRGWRGERFPTRHRFLRPGVRRVTARAHLAGADGAAVVESTGFDVHVRAVMEPWMEGAARAWTRNLLLGREVDVQASSAWSKPHAAPLCADGREHTAWMAGKDDRSPSVVLEPGHPVLADTVVLTQGVSRRNEWGHGDRITQLALHVNREDGPRIVDVDPEQFAPIVVELGRRTAVRRIEIRVLSRVPGTRSPGQVGFAEVALELCD